MNTRFGTIRKRGDAMEWKTTHFTNRGVRVKDYEPLPEPLGVARILLVFALVALLCGWVAYGSLFAPWLFGVALGGALFWCRCDDFNKSEIAMNKPLRGKEAAMRRRSWRLLWEGVAVTLLWLAETVFAFRFQLSLPQYILAGLSLVAFFATRLYPAFLVWAVVLAVSGVVA